MNELIIINISNDFIVEDVLFESVIDSESDFPLSKKKNDIVYEVQFRRNY